MSWATILALKIREAKPGDIIIVDSLAQIELAQRAAARLDKTGIVFKLRGNAGNGIEQTIMSTEESTMAQPVS